MCAVSDVSGCPLSVSAWVWVWGLCLPAWLRAGGCVDWGCGLPVCSAAGGMVRSGVGLPDSWTTHRLVLLATNGSQRIPQAAMLC